MPICRPRCAGGGFICGAANRWRRDSAYNARLVPWEGAATAEPAAQAGFHQRFSVLPSVSLLESFQTSQFTVMLVIYLVAITAEAMSGALAAGRRNMDIFGVAVIAFVTALGGGTIRDMVLGHYPIGWTQHPEYVYLVISAGLLTILVARHMHHLKQVFLLLDAMGLIAFSLIGCNVALELGYPPVVVVMSGMLTGISGGILRDVLCNQVPVVFRRELYASVSLAVCLLFLGLRTLDVGSNTSTAVCFAAGLTLRLAAIRFRWRLPVFSYQQRWEE
jgi:uncharacterized membrane protein YeiH